MVRRHFCEHVVVLPESASILFGGGFPRGGSVVAKKSAQRAIYYVQRELETVARSEPATHLLLCDRGTLDGMAYWPGAPMAMLQEVGTTYERELGRYDLVLHLRTPSARGGFSHSNELRVESAHEAREIDHRIIEAWRGHRHRVFVESSADFADKVRRALALVEAELPACCRDCRKEGVEASPHPAG